MCRAGVVSLMNDGDEVNTWITAGITADVLQTSTQDVLGTGPAHTNTTRSDDCWAVHMQYRSMRAVCVMSFPYHSPVIPPWKRRCLLRASFHPTQELASHGPDLSFVKHQKQVSIVKFKQAMQACNQGCADCGNTRRKLDFVLPSRRQLFRQ